MNSSGIYFGPKLITLVEVKGRKLVKSIQIPQPAAGGELETKASIEVALIQLVALIKEELRKKQIELKKTSLCLSGKDLIIRSFEIPLLPQSELKSAVNFEARKYIPFKGEDIVSDFQIKADHAKKSNQVLFMAIKKQALEKYISLLEQLGIEIGGVEYSAFSLLKLLKLTGIAANKITAVISADLEGNDETNFLVLKDGFPLFSRDFSLFSGADFIAGPENLQDSGMALEKFKTEIRVSLDYFHRKFSDQNIQRAVLITNPAYDNQLTALMKELGLPVEFVETGRLSKIMGEAFFFKLDLLKSYSAGLLNIKSKLKPRLLAVRAKAQGLGGPSVFEERLKELFASLKLDLRVLAASLLFCLFVYGAGILRTLPVKKEALEIKNLRPGAALIDPYASYEDLTKLQGQYQDKLKSLDKLIKERTYLTGILEAIPRVIPEGLWLKDFRCKFEENKQIELVLQGTCYLGERGRELEAIDQFLWALRNSPDFKKSFQETKIISVERREISGTQVSDFIISAKGA